MGRGHDLPRNRKPARGFPFQFRATDILEDRHDLATSSTGGVPYVWNESIVFRPQAWPFLRSASVQRIGFQSGARIRRAPALATSTRLPPGSYTYKKKVCWIACLCGPVSM